MAVVVISGQSGADLAQAGLRRAESELEAEGRVYTVATAADAAGALSTAAGQGYDLVIAADPLLAQALARIAVRFPRTSFAIVGSSWRTLAGAPPNARGLVFDQAESAYLAGAAVALVSRSHHVTSVGGRATAADVAMRKALRAGAAQTVPGTRVTTVPAGGETGRAGCRSGALSQIAAGSDAVLADDSACGAGVIEAAGVRKRWIVGVGADLSADGRRVLTSTVEQVDVAILEVARDAAAGRFRGGSDMLLGVANGGITLASVNDTAPRVLAARLASITAAIKAGKLQPAAT